ncbi:hypothetical protein ALT761_00548 [Alteromonas sp. 76-1]|jgi:hypothetical protein|uniref:hypothetical protein n=1 Tax=Alteromonas sp. 76-1 TaxID=2358187 RepID=UPI000FD17AE6|nr:hypothetical protein [Alteromonas sp. 76-1]VEL95593.1 hypothetical protein ALT761_00548 [Alteromonas sp. 76-1]
MKLAILYLFLGVVLSILTFATAYEDVSCFDCESLYIFNPISIVFAALGLIALLSCFTRVFKKAKLNVINDYYAKDLSGYNYDVDG